MLARSGAVLAASVHVGEVVGHAVRFGIESRDLGFREVVSDEAPDGADLNDVGGLFDHDPSAILGRTGAGTLDLVVERNVGLRYRIKLPSSPMGENVREAVARQDVSEASFAFEIAEDEWGVDDARDVVTRRILKIAKVFDVSPVTHVAYPGTSARIRE